MLARVLQYISGTGLGTFFLFFLKFKSKDRAESNKAIHTGYILYPVPVFHKRII